MPEIYGVKILKTHCHTDFEYEANVPSAPRTNKYSNILR